MSFLARAFARFWKVEARQFVDADTGAEIVGYSQGSGAPAGDPGSGNHVYLDTDDGTLYTWDGAAWAAVGGGSLTGETTADTTVLGDSAASTGIATTSLGTSADASAEGGTAVGAAAAASEYGLAVGASSGAGDNGVSVGANAMTSTYGTAVGKSANAQTGTHGVAVGAEALSDAASAVAIGAAAEASGASGVAIGAAASAGENATAIGAGASATDNHIVFAIDGEPLLDIHNDGGTFKIGFNGATAIAKPEVTGSKGANAALASLIQALVDLGLVSDATS